MGARWTLLPISALQLVYFLCSGEIEVLIGNEKGERHTANTNVRNGTWWERFARAACRPRKPHETCPISS